MKTGFLVLPISSARRVLGRVLAFGIIAGSMSAVMAAGHPAPSSTDQPSFSCASPDAIEAAICADPALSSRDRAMSVLYTASLKGESAAAPSPQRAAQRAWLKTRKECLNDDLRKCLAQQYDARLNSLAVAALFQSKDAALAELARQDPKVRPIYEAIYLYATRDTQAARIAAVEPLIAPIFNALSGMPTALFEDIPDARAAASSDDAFALFLDVASVSDYALTLPCDALVRRPGLIHALGAQYGGAIDGQLIQADCASTLPALPRLEDLVRAAGSVQETCEGTIRFSLGRNAGKTLVAVRLHRPDIWKAGDRGGSTSGPAAQFRSRHRAQIASAIAELAQYYAANFKVAPQVARADATSAIHAVVDGTFKLCELG